MKNGVQRAVERGVKIAMLATVGFVVFGFVVMFLWNWLMPSIFGLRLIGFWQALGLVVLSKILFGSFHSHGDREKQWQRRMKERWEKMTPEEREKFREGLEGFCGPVKAEPKA